jgi:hypothetical protein
LTTNYDHVTAKNNLKNIVPEYYYYYYGKDMEREFGNILGIS